MAPSGLADVVKEVIAALLEGDWTRYSDDTGTHFYYVFRERDHEVEVQSGECFNRLFILGAREDGAFEDWYIRSALAEEPTDRLKAFRERVIAARVDPRFMDAIIAASRRADSQDEIANVLDEWIPRIGTNNVDGLSALLEALRVDRVRQKQIFIKDSDRPAIRQALEMRFLKELAERFPKVVRRASEFDWLSFSDQQVREACRCYLYGFFRAAVLVSASALEERLKRATGIQFVERYELLIDRAFGSSGVCGADPARTLALKELFKVRNQIAHNGMEASQEDAMRTLDLVRDTFEHLAVERGGLA